MNIKEFKNSLSGFITGVVLIIGMGVASAAIVSPGAIQGINAPTGSIGEVISATIPANAASGVSLTSVSAVAVTDIAISKDITSAVLSAGDWEVWGFLDTSGVSATSTQIVVAIATSGVNASGVAPAAVNAITGGQDSFTVLNRTVTTTTVQDVTAAPHVRLNISTPTNVILEGREAYSAGTVQAGGTLIARRVR